VNGDDNISPLDALLIINFLNSDVVGEGESPRADLRVAAESHLTPFDDTTPSHSADPALNSRTDLRDADDRQILLPTPDAAPEERSAGGRYLASGIRKQASSPHDADGLELILDDVLDDVFSTLLDLSH
jgi:hypothetical protein